MEEKEFKEEKDHLKTIIELAKDELEETENNLRNIDDKSDDEYLLEQMARRYVTKIRNLQRAKEIPYFARIDVKFPNEKEKVYIGKTNIFDKDLNIAVADWRAPISTLYYDGKLGENEYNCPDGNQTVEMTLKRQYTIDNGELKNYVDVEYSTTDELLQDCLNEVSDVRMKNIVSTIQTEQNEIIRFDMKKPLIIQGVAGSGKTTVALHRIAYLVYTYDKTFKPEDFLIIAPNKFFLDYISNVLPDLGVDYVRQETFEDFAMNIIKEKICVEDSSTKLINVVNKKQDLRDIEKMSQFKTRLDFKQILDDYLENINQTIIPSLDFEIAGINIMKYDELNDVFLQHRDKFSIKSRIEMLDSYMKNKVYNYSEAILEKIKENRSEKIAQMEKEYDKEIANQKRIEIFKETEYEVNSLMKGGKKLVDDYIKRIKRYKILDVYKNAIDSLYDYDEIISNEEAKIIIENFNKLNKQKKIEYEDLAPLVYLQYKINGIDEKFALKHIVIDEAQDLSEMQFSVLHEILNKNKSITILGDLAQGIYSYKGTKDWNVINEKVFNNEATIKYLDKSYRTTIEIMNEANKILDKYKEDLHIKLAIPVSRHGKNVEYIDVKNFNEKIEKIESMIENMQNSGYKNIAIIGRDEKECINVYNELKKKSTDVNIIVENIEKYEGGVTVVPSYFAKGLEFDGVIVSDLNKYDNSVLDRQLLYVAYTRAMHVLKVIK